MRIILLRVLTIIVANKLKWVGVEQGQIGLAPILASKLAPQKFLAWLQKLAWPQICPLKLCLATTFFPQTDIFSVILIGFINWFYWIRFVLHKDNIYMLYFWKINIQVICQQLDWVLWFWCYRFLRSKISLEWLIWAGQCTWACFITFRNSMWLDYVMLNTYIKHNCSYQYCPVTQYLWLHNHSLANVI